MQSVHLTALLRSERRTDTRALTSPLLCSVLRQAVATKDHVVKKMVYLYRGGWRGAVRLVPQLTAPASRGGRVRRLAVPVASGVAVRGGREAGRRILHHLGVVCWEA